ncbi:PKD-like family lipoprotein [Chitinophaga sp.]|uniref:PKD-like family lipoprotein n=1 Tax=Chitinophaga sp. TaxID=1869181 RepID=UPI00260B55B4|nr:PKD-like family lipoprotein [uncultured Chitinophaga sp.]
MRIQILTLLSAVSLAGCYKDNGNYDYKPINKIVIEGGKAPEALSVVFNDSLKITPDIEQSMPAAEADLMYEWTVYDNSPASSYVVPTDTVSRERNLAIKVGSPVFILGQNYRLGYKVTDKRTGLSGVHYYNLTIGNKYARGWMFLEQTGNSGDFSMILPDGSVEHNIYSTINAGMPIGKPVKLELSAWSITDDISAPSRRMYLLYENGGMELNYQTLQHKFDYGYLFFLAPEVQKPVVHTWVSNTPPAWTPSASMGIAINDGKVHANLVGGFPGSKKWGGVLLTPEGTPNYTLSPYVVGGSTYTAIVHDNVGKRFLSVATSGLQRFPTQVSTEFDMNDTGMDLVFMDSANVTRYYNAVMKDAAGAPWLLQFKAIVNTGESPVITLGKQQMNAPGAAQLTAAAGSTITPHIFYATGNKILRYETTSNTAAEEYVFPATEQVTSMKFRRVPGGVSELVAATWNGTAGRVYIFDVSNIGDISLSGNAYGGFGKIVDIGYKVP